MNEPQKLMFSQSIFAQSATRKEQLGALRILSDGRKFRYAKAGGTALTAAVPIESLPAVANNINCDVAANVAVGSTTVSVTLGATAVSVNQYAGGYLQINAGAGLGMQYKISSHPAIASAGTGNITLAEPIQVALTSAASKASLIYSPYTGCVASTANDAPAGVPPIAVTASYYFWSQTGGVCAAICANALGVGVPVIMGVASFAAASAATDLYCGYMYATAGVTSQAKPVFLTID